MAVTVCTGYGDLSQIMCNFCCTHALVPRIQQRYIGYIGSDICKLWHRYIYIYINSDIDIGNVQTEVQLLKLKITILGHHIDILNFCAIRKAYAHPTTTLKQLQVHDSNTHQYQNLGFVFILEFFDCLIKFIQLSSSLSMIGIYSCCFKR